MLSSLFGLARRSATARRTGRHVDFAGIQEQHAVEALLQDDDRIGARLDAVLRGKLAQHEPPEPPLTESECPPHRTKRYSVYPQYASQRGRLAEMTWVFTPTQFSPPKSRPCSIFTQRSMTVSTPAALALAAAASFFTPSCCQKTLAPMAMASSTIGGTSAVLRNTSTRS